MAFEVIWTNRSKKDLKLLDRQTALRIIEKVDMFSGQDSVFLEKVKGTEYFKSRVGRYRVLVKKFPASKKLFVLKVRHRKKFYKGL